MNGHFSIEQDGKKAKALLRIFPGDEHWFISGVFALLGDDEETSNRLRQWYQSNINKISLEEFVWSIQHTPVFATYIKSNSYKKLVRTLSDSSSALAGGGQNA